MNLIDRIYTGTTNSSDVGLFSAIIMACLLLGFIAGYAIGVCK